MADAADGLGFLSGGGEASELIRQRDWSGHPLGPPQTWPPTLKTNLSLVLNSPESMILSWFGPDRALYFFFNDTYFPLLGPRLAWAMGERFERVWADAWGQAKPIIDDALAGRTRRFTDLPWKLDVDRGVPETFWSFSYSRVLDEAGAPAGVFIFTNETTDRVRADEALRASQEKLRLEAERQRRSLQQMPGFIALLDGPDHAFTYVNDAYVTLAGPRAYLGRSVREVFPDLVDQGFFELLDRVYATGEPFTARDLPVRLAGRGGDSFVDLLYQAVRDDAGAVTGVFVGGYDVTDAVRTTRALADSEIRYRALFDAIDEGFCLLEFLDGPHGPLSDCVHVEANEAYVRHAGISDVVGQTVREMAPDEADGWIELYRGVLLSGQPIRFQRELLATGRFLELAAFRAEPASRRQVAVLFQDITERRRAEMALKQLNETLEARVAQALAERKVMADLVEGATAFIQVLDPDFHLMAINRAAADEFARIFGVRPEVGDDLLALLADQPQAQAQVRAFWTRALAGEEYVVVDEFGDATRDRRFHEVHFNSLRDEAGRLIGAYQFTFDVTERLKEQEQLAQMQEVLRQSQKMEAVGQLTGGLAHDFNNLLAGISGSLELIQTRMDQGRVSEVGRYVVAAQGAARRAASLTHRLLAFSRRQTLDPRPTNVNALVAGMEEMIRRTVGPGVEVEVVGMAGVWPTLVDPPQLENALLNLCINARDAMPDGGRITIETANKWLDRHAALQHDLPEGQYVSLCVTDTGAGMTPDVIDKAFDPFFTTKPIGEGTGLGLSMIYGFTKQSGGQVRIYSEVSRGTTVCLYLPRHRGELAEPDPLDTIPAAARSERGETVLVVDDEPTVRMLVTEVLGELGYTVLEAADSASGLRVLNAQTPIDLLVTDVGLPGGMNGRQMADAARAVRPGLKVLFITGYAENAVLGNGQLGPGMAVLTKPFVIEVLAARVREIIAS